MRFYQLGFGTEPRSFPKTGFETGKQASRTPRIASQHTRNMIAGVLPSEFLDVNQLPPAFTR